MIVIPLGGCGQRFRDNGYVSPKALIPLLGRPMIFYLLDCISAGEVLVICGSDYMNCDVHEQIAKEYPHLTLRVHQLNRPTRGAAETILFGLSGIAEQPVLCLDGDVFYSRPEIVSKWQGENNIFVFHDNGPNDHVYSYVELDGAREAVLAIAEKQRISNDACTGAYGFRSCRELRDACQTIIDGGHSFQGEFFTSAAIQHLLAAGHAFQAIHVQPHEWYCLGSPLQMRLHALMLRRDEKYRFCFEIDHTLVHCDADYRDWTPIPRNISFLRFLHSEGHTIILHTARAMHKHSGNVGQVIADVGVVTTTMLEALDIPYDELIFGKPHAQFYIDGLAINAQHDLEKATGFYCNGLEPRSFHTLHTTTTKVIRKQGEVASQIHYYLHIPTGVRHLFPSMLDYAIDGGNSWYDMTFLEALPFSQLYVSELMTGSHLQLLLDGLHQLHSSAAAPHGLDLYGNYARKLRERYEGHTAVYDALPDAKSVYGKIAEALQKHEDEDGGVRGVVHGDPVFTNVLLQANDRLKFIDMRGRVGDTDTIFGDVLYDYAKVYQSLFGYDEILLNVRVGELYRQKMLAIFRDHVGAAAMGAIMIIACSHIFSLIPLHTSSHKQFYELCTSLVGVCADAATEMSLDYESARFSPGRRPRRADLDDNAQRGT